MDEVSGDVSRVREAHGLPAVLRTVVICLTVLAVVAAAGGMAGGLVVLAGAESSAGVGRLLVHVLAYFLGGWCAGAMLWAAAWMLRQQYELAAAERRILELLDVPGALILGDRPAGPAPAAAQRAAPSPDAPAAGAPSSADPASPPRADDSQVLRQILAELAEIRADLLLSPAQREARREEIRQRRIDSLVSRAEYVIQSGEPAEAEKLLAELAAAAPDHARMADLRARLAERLADEAQRALMTGDVAGAEQMLARAAEAGGSAQRIAQLRQEVAGHFVHEIDRLLDRGDLAGASAKLDSLTQRYGDDPRCAQLRNRLSAARASVEDGEVRRQRRRVEELMAVAAFDRAEAIAEQLAARHPNSPEAAGLQALVRREAVAFREERRARLFGEIQRFVESRRWRRALDAARRLLEDHRDCSEGRDVLGMMPTLEENAKIEEVRELRDRIRDLVRRRRFAEAADIARDLIRRFPDTQAAIQLRQQLPRLEQRAASGEGHTA